MASVLYGAIPLVPALGLVGDGHLKLTGAEQGLGILLHHIEDRLDSQVIGDLLPAAGGRQNRSRF